MVSPGGDPRCRAAVLFCPPVRTEDQALPSAMLTRCRHCRIFSLTHPCNAGRNDLGCPFGCRNSHRKRRSTERSVGYYRTPEGKHKKKIQNGKRAQLPAVATLCSGASETGRNLVPPHDSRFDPQMVCYVRMVTSVIEGRRVSISEILEMLVRAVRQHSMVRRRCGDSNAPVGHRVLSG